MLAVGRGSKEALGVADSWSQNSVGEGQMTKSIGGNSESTVCTMNDLLC